MNPGARSTAAGPRALTGWPTASVLAALPGVLSGVRAVTGHWAPVIDNAVISVKADDAWRGHLPTVGIYTSLTQAADWPHHLYHPGPVEFWALAPFEGLLGASGIGLAIGAAAVNAVAAAIVVWVAHRLSGTPAAWVAAAAVALWSWALGGQVLHDPWNPHLGLLPCLAVLCLAAAVGSGDLHLLPLLVGLASAVMELHLTFVLPCAGAVLVAAVGLAVAVRRRPPGDPARRWGRWTAGAVAVGLAVWSGPLVNQADGGGNLSGLVRASAAVSAHLGIARAWRGLVAAITVPPAWWQRSDALVSRQGPVAWWQIVLVAALLAGLLALTVRAWQRRQQAVVACVAVAFVALVGAAATVARTPAGFGYDELRWARGVWLPVGVFVWLVAALALGTELRAHRFAHRPWISPSIAACAGAAGLVLVGLAWPHLGAAHDYGSAGFGPVRALGPAAAAATSGGGAWELESMGEFAGYVVGPGVAAQLVARGRDVRVPPSVNLDLGSRHALTPAETLTGTVLVVSGDASPPPGFERVATWTPATAPSPYRSYRTTMFLVPIEPVSVYVRRGATS